MYETNTNLFQFSDQMSPLPWGWGEFSAPLDEIKLSLYHLKHVVIPLMNMSRYALIWNCLRIDLYPSIKYELFTHLTFTLVASECPVAGPTRDPNNCVLTLSLHRIFSLSRACQICFGGCFECGPQKFMPTLETAIFKLLLMVVRGKACWQAVVVRWRH